MELDFGKKDLTFSIIHAPLGSFSRMEALDLDLIREDQRYPSCELFQNGYGSTFPCGASNCRKLNNEWHRNSSEESWCLVQN